MSDRGFVLVIDDDADLRDTVAEALEEEGYAVTTAANGLEALRLLRAGARPDVILLDLMMPGLDGWGFRAEQLRDPAIASIPVIVFTAYGVPEDAAEQLQALVMQKPILLRDLFTTMERAQLAS